MNRYVYAIRCRDEESISVESDAPSTLETISSCLETGCVQFPILDSTQVIISKVRQAIFITGFKFPLV